MKIALGVEYDGSNYYGWQRQQTVPSIQEKIEIAVSRIANESVNLVCAGRTDAGVHATGQVIHFETQSVRDNQAWTRGVNANLPNDIVIRWACPVSDKFNARFSAISREYRYIICNTQFRPAILHNGVTHYHLPLNAEKMHRSARCLLGEHDFSAFRAAQCQSKTPWRHVFHLNVVRINHYIIIDIQANAFVHHMVRNIVGSLLAVGNGEKGEEWIDEILNSCDRTLAGVTAKPHGLYLVNVAYPTECNIPKLNPGPLFVDSLLS